jgi:hypothetical protein
MAETTDAFTYGPLTNTLCTQYLFSRHDVLFHEMLHLSKNFLAFPTLYEQVSGGINLCQCSIESSLTNKKRRGRRKEKRMVTIPKSL